MRNKEVAATTTLLNNGEQVLVIFFLILFINIKTISNIANIENIVKVVTTLPIRREVVWKHGTPFPGTHATTRRFVPDRYLPLHC